MRQTYGLVILDIIRFIRENGGQARMMEIAKGINRDNPSVTMALTHGTRSGKLIRVKRGLYEVSPNCIV